MSEPDIVLPEFDRPMAPPSVRTMDEIDAWIEETYSYFFDRDRYEEEKRGLSVVERLTIE